MKFTQPRDFIAAIRSAPYENKRNWICSLVKGKDVLDLGVVAHSLDFCLNHRDTWLHGLISEHAASVLGVDVLKEEVRGLEEMGFNVIVADALTLRLNRKFDVVVCGDLIEHVSNPGALLDTIGYHLCDNGVGVVTTPNPMAISRFFNILADGWTDINTEHVSWFCPQTMFQLTQRSKLLIDEFCWLETDFSMPTKHRQFGRLLNFAASHIANKKQLFRNDYGVVLKKKPEIATKLDFELPFVTVVLPTFNRRAYLEDAFQTLVGQDYPSDRFEIIVVDNGSTDDTPQRMAQVALETNGKVNFKFVREERPGLVFARHTGAAHARGEILLFGDDDAVFDKNWISAVVQVFNDHSEVGAVGTKISIRWDRKPDDWVRKHERILGKLDYGDQLLIQPGLFINGGSFAIKKEILYQVRGFNPGQRGGFLVGDSETGLCRKLAEEGVPVAWTPTTTMWHLQRADINGTLGDLKRRFRNNGISDAYYASFYGWRRRQLLADIVLKSRSLLSKLRDLFVQRADANSRRNLLLGLWHYRYYMAYLWLYRFNSKVRAEVQKVDWLFSANYERPPTVFASQHEQDDFREADHSACDSNRLT